VEIAVAATIDATNGLQVFIMGSKNKQKSYSWRALYRRIMQMQTILM